MPTKLKRTSKQMFPIIKRYMTADMSQRQFCELNQIELHVFRYWLKKYNEIEPKESSSFSSIELELSTSRDHIVIRTKAGVEIQVPI